MKNPQYKIGDYVEFMGPYNTLMKGFIYEFLHAIMGGEDYATIRMRNGKHEYVRKNKIIRKLPILRDNNGRFTSKDKLDYSKYLKDWRDSLNKRMDEALFEKSCSCFNCDKCAEQMRAYYEKTGELKPKMGKNWGKIKDTEGNYHEFGNAPIGSTYDSNTDISKPYDDFGNRVEHYTLGTQPHKPSVTTCFGSECTTQTAGTPSVDKTKEKKPSERIGELVFTLETRDEKERLLVARIMAIFGKVLDEQFEKGKK